MIVAIPVEEKDLKGAVCPSFGRAPFYVLYESGDETVSYIDNPAAQASGGAGIKAAQLLVDNRVEAVLTPRCGTNSAEVLEAAEISIYKSTNGSVKDNVDCFQKGTLAVLTSFHAGFHGHRQ